MKVTLNELIIKFDCSPKLVMSFGAHGIYSLCRTMLHGFALLLVASTMVSCGQNKVTVSVTNNSGFELGPRCVELEASNVLGRLGTVNVP